MENNKKWINEGVNYSYSDIPEVNDKLAYGIYELKMSLTGFYLEKISDNFELPSKIYDNEKNLVTRIKKSFNAFNKNFGVLLKGLKGTGKTVTAKQLCNDLKLPVILVTSHFPNIGTFINSIQQDIVLFFDEFEKTYELHSYSNDDDGEIENVNDGKKGIGSLLTLMDGVFTSEYKRLFLLTTNKEYMPDAMMSRPSRIRYVKDFTDLSFEGIQEILDDIVKTKELIPQLMLLMRDLEIITVDIVKSIAEEANMYNTADPEFFSIFNVKRAEKKCSIYKVLEGGVEECMEEETYLNPTNVYPGTGLNMNGEYYRCVKTNPAEGTFTAQFNDGNKKNPILSFKFKKALVTHKSMEKYVF